MKIVVKSSSFICTPYTFNHDYSTNSLYCQLSIKYITFTLTSLTHIIMKIIIRVMIMIVTTIKMIIMKIMMIMMMMIMMMTMMIMVFFSPHRNYAPETCESLHQFSMLHANTHMYLIPWPSHKAI